MHPFCEQVRVDYIRFIDHCRACHEINAYTFNWKNGVGVGVPTWTGDCSSSTDAEAKVMVTACIGAAVEFRFTGPAATMDISAGTGVHVGAKLFQPTQG